MLIDELIHGFHQAAEMALEQAQTAPAERRDTIKANAGYEYHLAGSLNNAVRYWLDIQQIERFRAAKFAHLDFPPIIHDRTFVEFNGLLRFNFRPWKRNDLIVSSAEDGMKPPPLREDIFAADQYTTDYKGVFIQVNKPPHRFYGWPKDENVIRVWWFEKANYITVESGLGTVPALSNYTISMTPTSWPRRFDSLQVMENDELIHAGERSHGDRLFTTTVNLLYFLAAENIVKIKIRPGDHARHGRDLAGLPKSDREYHVLPFQLPRYRYLHQTKSESTGRHLSVCFDVRGHFRSLRDDRFERNEDGSVRVIWVSPHQRGEGNPYQPALRRGAISSMFLDYDKFIREETMRVNKSGAPSGS